MVLRADAQRNLERVLDAATEAFAASGPDVSVHEIAERAGVGHATVFRRFPTKDDLMLAVIARRVVEIREIFEDELKADDPGEAFFRAMSRVAELHRNATGLLECVAHCEEKPGAVDLEPLGQKLIARAQRAGTMRRDVEPAAVQKLLKTVLQTAPENVGIVLDGLRARG